MDSESFNRLVRCQQAAHLLMNNKETLELSKDEEDTLVLIQESITQDIRLITGEQQVII